MITIEQVNHQGFVDFELKPIKAKKGYSRLVVDVPTTDFRVPEYGQRWELDIKFRLAEGS